MNQSVQRNLIGFCFTLLRWNPSLIRLWSDETCPGPIWKILTRDDEATHVKVVPQKTRKCSFVILKIDFVFPFQRIMQFFGGLASISQFDPPKFPPPQKKKKKKQQLKTGVHFPVHGRFSHFCNSAINENV